MKTTQDKKPKKLPKNTEKIRKEPPEGKEYDAKGRLVFKKGYSGNPDGKPEGAFSLLSILRAELQKVPEEYKKDKKTYADLIIKRMLADAIKKGDDQKIKLIWNYIEGMPKQNIEVDNPAQTEAIKSLENIIKEIRK